MKKRIKKADGSVITIESEDEVELDKLEAKIKKDIEKANQINKIEPIEKINM